MMKPKLAATMFVLVAFGIALCDAGSLPLSTVVIAPAEAAPTSKLGDLSPYRTIVVDTARLEEVRFALDSLRSSIQSWRPDAVLDPRSEPSADRHLDWNVKGGRGMGMVCVSTS
jgi:hypothetical protein